MKRMNILGIKIGGAGKVDKERPYPGYKLCYGSKSLSAVKALNGIPLAFTVANYFTYRSSNGTYAYPRIWITVKGVNRNISSTFKSPSDTAVGNQSCGAGGHLYVDIDSFLGGDMEQLKEITNIYVDYDYKNTSSYDGRNNVGCYIGGITRWLESISSGGGGLNSRLLKGILELLPQRRCCHD